MRHPLLGRLSLEAVFVYYDEPRLFTCTNATGTRLLVVWTDELDDADQWLAVPVSTARMEALKSGRVPLRDAFTHPEDGFVLRVTAPHDQTQFAAVEPIPPDTIHDADLPRSEAILPSLVPDASPEVTPFDLDWLCRQAAAVRREMITIWLEPHGSRRREGDAEMVGTTLVNAQSLITALTQAATGTPTTRGVVPATVARESKLSLVQAPTSSFGLVLAAAHRTTPFGNTTLQQALEELSQLLAVANNPGELRKTLARLQARAAGHYARFLESVVRAGGVEIEWSNPFRERSSYVSMSGDTANSTLSLVRQLEPQTPDEYTVTVKLIGVNVRKKSFEVHDLETAQQFSGRIDDDAMAVASHAVINDRYEATIRETTQISETTDETRTKYRLLGLQPVK